MPMIVMASRDAEGGTKSQEDRDAAERREPGSIDQVRSDWRVQGPPGGECVARDEQTRWTNRSNGRARSGAKAKLNIENM